MTTLSTGDLVEYGGQAYEVDSVHPDGLVAIVPDEQTNEPFVCSLVVDEAELVLTAKWNERGWL